MGIFHSRIAFSALALPLSWCNAAMGRIVAAFLSIVLLSGGCSDRVNTWVGEQGGLVADSRQARVDSAAGPLLRQCGGKHIEIRVLDNDAVTAYGWRGGSLFLTRRLVDLMDDNELAATIAHELGHLLDDGHVRSMTSLRGCEQEHNLDLESRADLIGAELLRNAHISPTAMAGMLRKVQDQGRLAVGCRQAVSRRIELLVARLPSDQ